jgi:hypothetical protein
MILNKIKLFFSNNPRLNVCSKSNKVFSLLPSKTCNFSPFSPSLPKIFKMQVTVELLNDHALNLLYELEQMSIIRFLKTDKEIVVSNTPLMPNNKSRFAGRISKNTAEKLHLQLNEMREEWHNNI